MKTSLLRASGSFAVFLFLFQPGKLPGVPAPKEKFIFIDLQTKANQKRTDSFITGRFEGNDLSDLPKGEQKFAGVRFKIGAKVIQLYGTQAQKWPAQVEGIAVGQKFTKLHVLHATGFKSEENTVIGSYTIHYADKTKATLDIVYGKDLRDWMARSDAEKEIGQGKMAWEGTNPSEKKNGGKVRLFLRTWKNPHPKKKVVSIDFTSAKTLSAPFCVAMTIETK
jgi:hypothetical protein